VFDDVHFTGTINLGSIIVAVVALINAYAVLVRVRALIAEHDLKDKLPGGRRKTDPPALADQVIPPASPASLPPPDKKSNGSQN
jgi:hypothetical protein